VQNRDVANTLFLSIYHKVSQHTCSRYTCHCNFIHTIKVRTEFPAVILAEHTRAQQHYMQVSCRDFNQNPASNGSPLTPVSQVFMAFTVSITTESNRFLWLSPVPSLLIRIELYKIALRFYYSINYRMAVTELCLVQPLRPRTGKLWVDIHLHTWW
jgi:hypothetical protein